MKKKLKKCSHGKSETDELYGAGLAMSYRGMSIGAEGADICAAMLNVQPDGSVILETGIHENGQGSESAMCKILSRELGISLGKIRYRRASTSVIPDSGTTVASRGTVMGGGAIADAVKGLKVIFGKFVKNNLGWISSEIKIENDIIYGKNESISFDEIAKKMYLSQEYPHSFGVFRAPKVTWNEKTGQGKAYFSFTYGCQAIELTVNKKTGKVKLLNAVAVHDAGKVANKEMALGQFYGGMAMGIGYGLFEDLKINEGKISSLNFNSYRIPRATDMPEMKAIIIENPDPNSPSGAKGIGEPVNEIMAPAIANAIYNATGKRYFKLPVKIKTENESTH